MSHCMRTFIVIVIAAALTSAVGGQESGLRGNICAALSSDGKYLAVGNEEGNIQVWDLSGPKMLREIAIVKMSDWLSRAEALAFNPRDSKELFLASTKGISRWRWPSDDRATAIIQRPRVFQDYVHFGDPLKIALNDEGRKLFCEFNTGAAAILDLERPEESSSLLASSLPFRKDTLQARFSRTRPLCYAPTEKKWIVGRSGRLLLISESDMREGRWGTTIWSAPDGSSIDGGSFCRSVDKGVVCYRDAGIIEILNIPKRNSLRIKSPDGEKIDAVSISSDGERIVGASSTGRLRVYRASTGQLICEGQGPVTGIMEVGFYDDDTRIYATGERPPLEFFRLPSRDGLPLEKVAPK